MAGPTGPTGPQGTPGPTGPSGAANLPANKQGFLYDDGHGTYSWVYPIPGATVANTSTDITAVTTGSIWFNTVDARTYVQYNGQWVDANPSVTPPTSTYLDGLVINGTTISKVDYTTSTDITITNNTSSWKFGTNGSITFPDNSVQYTAYTGDGGGAGQQGATGPQGPTGPRGPQGPIGPQGNQGNPGSQGNQGATGPIGPSGPQGVPGNDSMVPGPTGPIGPSGPAGSGSASITVSDTAPSASTTGTMWWDENSGSLFIAYEGVWVPASINPPGTTATNTLTNSSGSLVLPANTNNVSIDGASSNIVSMNTNDTVTFSNFSGEILINDYYNGYMYSFLVGSGNVWLMGSTNGNWNPSAVSPPGSSAGVTDWCLMSFTDGAYVFTNLATNASPRDFNFVTIKTRSIP